MDIHEKIQLLRKAQGLSQEELADRLGVSRQAVSKWEMGQSLPELDKVLLLSEYFQVSTDYLLKGEEAQTVEKAPAEQDGTQSKAAMGRALYIASAALIWLGLAAACALWHEWQNAPALLIGFALQITGISAYVAAKWMYRIPAPRIIKALSVVPILFMPLSLLACRILGFVAAPYPTGLSETALFIPLWGSGCALALKKLGFGHDMFRKTES